MVNFYIKLYLNHFTGDHERHSISKVTVYSVYCTVTHTRTLYIVHCTVYIVQYIMNTAPFNICEFKILQFKIYTCTPYFEHTHTYIHTHVVHGTSYTCDVHTIHCIHAYVYVLRYIYSRIGHMFANVFDTLGMVASWCSI